MGSKISPNRASILIQNIGNYYTQIDNLEIQGVLSRFAPRAKYKRNGWNPFKNLAQIRDFFTHKRTLRGAHQIDEISYVEANQIHNHRPKDAPKLPSVFVRGSFNGNNNGVDIQGLKFTDWWSFNPENQVVYRNSVTTNPGV